MNNLFDLLYLIYAEKASTQDGFAKELGLSVGKTNQLISEAVDKGYLESTLKYELTTKAKDWLEEYRVDNAIIMAAGFGSRFVPMTYDLPKGLLEVKGEVLIERQIKQLHEVGIKDITIVVGYLKETFEYLQDKYNVKLIYNKDFAEKNNISSIYHAQKEFKNTYLLTSDIYMPNNLYRTFEYYSNYATEYHVEKTFEWTVELNKSNLILSVDPKGGSESWAINGPAFFTNEYSQKLVELTNALYNEKYAAQWYWEDIWIRNMEDLPMYARKHDLGTIIEFESLEELRAFDETYFDESRSEIIDVIQKVFEVDLIEIKNIETLKEGMTNDSFLFEVKDTKYVFRNPGKGTEALINRANEYNVYQAIKDLKVSDEIIFIDPDKGYKITKYIHNARHLDHDNKDELDSALKLIKQLHNSGIVIDNEFDIEERINHYYNLCVEADAVMFRDYDDVSKIINQVNEYVKGLDRPKVLSHIDFVVVNVLFDDSKVYLLDWEYAGMADPLIDIAMYVLFIGLQDNEISELLDAYLNREHTKEELLVTYSYITLAGFLWSLWSQYKQAKGDNFGTYSMEQYAYARKYGRIVLNEK